MRWFRSTCLTLLLVIVPVFSFAATRKSISVPEPVKVGSTLLQPGDYTVEWDGNGPTVQVTFKQNNKTVVIAPATVTNQSGSNYDNALDIKSGQDNSAKTLHAIDFKKMALVFDEGSTTATQSQ